MPGPCKMRMTTAASLDLSNSRVVWLLEGRCFVKGNKCTGTTVLRAPSLPVKVSRVRYSLCYPAFPSSLFSHQGCPNFWCLCVTLVEGILGHTLNTQTLTKTDEQKKKKVLSKFTILCWATFIVILGHRRPTGRRLDTSASLDKLNCSLTSFAAWCGPGGRGR